MLLIIVVSVLNVKYPYYTCIIIITCHASGHIKLQHSPFRLLCLWLLLSQCPSHATLPFFSLLPLSIARLFLVSLLLSFSLAVIPMLWSITLEDMSNPIPLMPSYLITNSVDMCCIHNLVFAYLSRPPINFGATGDPIGHCANRRLSPHVIITLSVSCLSVVTFAHCYLDLGAYCLCPKCFWFS